MDQDQEQEMEETNFEPTEEIETSEKSGTTSGQPTKPRDQRPGFQDRTEKFFKHTELAAAQKPETPT